VLAVGDPPEALAPLLRASEPDAAMVRLLFSELGRRLTLEKALRAAEGEGRQLRRDVEHRERDIAELRAVLAAERARLEQAAATRATLDQIQGSKAWRAVQRYRTLRDEILRSGAAGRRIVDRTLRRGS
jgi:hypothetical protein